MTLWVVKCSPAKRTSKLFSLVYRNAVQKDLRLPKCLPPCVFQHCGCWQMLIKSLLSPTSFVEHLTTIHQVFLSPLINPLDPHNLWVTNLLHFFIPFLSWTLRLLAMRSNIRQHTVNVFPCKHIRHFHLELQWFLSPWSYPLNSNCILSFSWVKHLFYYHFKQVSGKQPSFQP